MFFVFLFFFLNTFFILTLAWWCINIQQDSKTLLLDLNLCLFFFFAVAGCQSPVVRHVAFFPTPCFICLPKTFCYIWISAEMKPLCHFSSFVLFFFFFLRADLLKHMLPVIMCLLYILINNKMLFALPMSFSSSFELGATFEVAAPRSSHTDTRSREESCLIINVIDFHTLASVHN